VDLFGSSPFIAQPSYKSAELGTQHCIEVSATIDLTQLQDFNTSHQAVYVASA
jgi:hypothetical protein